MLNPKKTKIFAVSAGAILLALILIFTSFQIGIHVNKNDISKTSITIGSGHEIYAAGTTIPDFYTTGTNDYQVFQNALNLLPASGGMLQVLTGTYNWGSGNHIVTRAINNIIIQGCGGGTSFVGDGVNAIFSSGSQTGWAYRDFITDAGGITNYTSAYLSNVTLGVNYFTVRAPNTVGNIAAPSVTDSGLTAGQAVYAGTGGLLSSEAGYEYNAGTNTLSVPTLSSTTVGATTLNAPTGRGATYTIAASDATTLEKAQADYIMPNAGADLGAIITTQASAGNTNILLSTGNFSISPFTLSVNGTIVKGSGRLSTELILIANSNATAIELTGQFIELSDFTLNGNRSNQAAGSWNGIGLNYDGAGGIVDNFEEAYIHDLWITQCKNAGIATESGLFITSNTLRNVICQSNNIGFDLSKAYGMGLTGCGARLNDKAGLFCSGGQDIFFTSCFFDDNLTSGASTGYGVLLYGCSRITFTGGEITNNSNHGVHISQDINSIADIRFVGVKISSNNIHHPTFANVYVASLGSTGHYAHNISFIGCMLGKAGTDASLCSVNCPIGGTDRVTNFMVAECTLIGGSDNNFSACTIPIIQDNTGYIAQGEIRTISGTIATLTQDAFNSVNNPFGQAVRVLNLQINVSTAATATSPNIDCGIGSSATTDYTTLFDDLPGETIGYYTSTITTPGTQTVPQTWASGSGNRYLNMSIKDAAATGMVSTYTVTVMGN